MSALPIYYLCLVIFFTSFKAESAGTYASHICSNDTVFDRNGSYGDGLHYLLSSLSTNATYDAYYDNLTVGEGINRVFGLFLCRRDLSVDVCHDCVNSAANDTLDRCPNRKEAIIWYDQCMLRYSYRNFFSRKQMDPGAYINSYPSMNRIDLERFTEVLMTTMTEAVDAASAIRNRFAARRANFTRSRTLYVVLQCTPDLKEADCDSCLRQVVAQVPGCCSGISEGRVVVPSCYVWYSVRPFINESGVDLPPANLPMNPAGSKSAGKGISRAKIVAIVVGVLTSTLIFIGCCLLLRRLLRKKYNAVPDAGNDITTADSLQFDFQTILKATNMLSKTNRLGAGGFGEVFKGRLQNGEEIAVKRLSESSGQGIEQFKNEVLLMAKLQHRNLVRLLGFCVEGREKMLIYEFVPNRSLDYFLSDGNKRKLLDWRRRYNIIAGVARGILYLHRDSQLTIIHRDLKSSNILLESNMNPKIADFGLARILDAEESERETRRIVGTYGYMAPEYAKHGQFSMKSDIYSFGVLILELVTGKKISSFDESDEMEGLIVYVWKSWSEGLALEMLDPWIRNECSRDEVVRCIHVGLLCVQDDAARRPHITSVVIMLSGVSVSLPPPNQPGFHLGIKHPREHSKQELCSNPSSSLDKASLTTTEMYPR